MSKKIGGYSETHLVNVARDAVGKKTKNTVVLDQEAEDRIPKFANGGVYAKISLTFAVCTLLGGLFFSSCLLDTPQVRHGCDC